MSYFTYGDKPLEWAEQVPTDWDRNRLKCSVRLCTNRPTDSEQDTLPYISNEDIESWTGKLLTENPKPSRADSRIFQCGDVLFNKLRPYLAKVHHATFDGVSSSELLCLRPSQGVESRFLFYVLLSKGFIDAVNAATFGAKMPRADWEIVGHQQLPLPPLETQRRIARFLDKKTARIDALIEKKRELLERLAEKRQALITRAVTQGLNPGAPSARSDEGEHHKTQKGSHSSAEGAGSVNTAAKEAGTASDGLVEGWTRRRLRFDVKLNPKKSSLDMEPSQLVSFIAMDAIGEHGGLNLDEVREFGEVCDGYTYFADGDLCIAKITPCFENGKGSLVKGLVNGVGFGTTELHVIRPGSNIDRRFLFYISISDDFRKIGESKMYGAAGQKRVGEAFIKDWMPPLPPLRTQQRIARFLDNEAARIDKLTNKIRHSIECLSEYRTAVITAAVTGQIARLA